MQTIIEKLQDVLEWMHSALQRLTKYLKRKEEERRRKQIEKLVVRLWRLSAIHKVHVDDMDYVGRMEKRKCREYLWIVDYYHKYIFGRDE